MLPQTWDFRDTHISPDKARLKHEGRGHENKIGEKTKLSEKIMRVLLKEGGRNKDAGERSELELRTEQRCGPFTPIINENKYDLLFL